LSKIVPQWSTHKASTSNEAVEIIEENCEPLPLSSQLKPFKVKLPEPYRKKYGADTITITNGDVWNKMRKKIS